MKKLTLVLLFAICIVSLFDNSVFADDYWSYDFLINGIEVNISSEEEISETFAYNIAHRIVFEDEIIDSINGTYCNIYGHTFVYTTATTITHRYYSSAPRCVEKKYKVSTCSVCGYETRTLTSSSRIYCC